MTKKTIILGASPKPERYAFRATKVLAEKGHPVFPIGIKKGNIGDHQILLNTPKILGVDTVTLYVGPKNQPKYYDYILETIQPNRIIFNPGTENSTFISLAQKKGIVTEIACTLVLLSLNNY